MNELDEESVKAYAMISANTMAQARLDSFAPPSAPKEKFMSMATVMEQRRKIDQLCAKLRFRETVMTRELADG